MYINQIKIIRIFDFLISLFGLILLSPLLIILSTVGLLKNGYPIFKQTRLGVNQKKFSIYKFRTMYLNTLSVPSHLVKHSSITPFGYFLRHTKMDELPQLFNVLFGNMSLVGPRPCMTNQKKLILERKKKGVFLVKPGITGLAQIKGITMKNPLLLTKTDQKMIKDLNLYNYFYYIFRTIFFFKINSTYFKCR